MEAVLGPRGARAGRSTVKLEPKMVKTQSTERMNRRSKRPRQDPDLPPNAPDLEDPPTPVGIGEGFVWASAVRITPPCAARALSCLQLLGYGPSAATTLLGGLCGGPSRGHVESECVCGGATMTRA